MSNKGFSLDRAIEHLYDLEVIEELEAALDKVCGADPATLCDGEAIEALHRCEAAWGRPPPGPPPPSTPRGRGRAGAPAAGWLAVRCGVTMGAAKRRVGLGRALRHLPAAAAAWLAGDIGEAHVSALARARTAATEEAMARDE